MREAWNQRGWLRHLTIAVLYFVGYTALRQISFSFWLLPAGFRLFCLLVMPYRYWPALAAGEMLSVGKESYDCYDSFGPVYALLKLVPPSIMAMPIVHACRQRLAMIGPGRQIRVNVFLLCTLAVSLLLAGYNYLRYWISPLPAGAQHITLEWLPRYFLGQFLGVLTVTPLALLLWQEMKAPAWKTSWARLGNSRLAMDSAVVLLPSLALLMWLAMHATGSLSMGARIAMFLPVATLTMRHGWQGAAIGGTAASAAIAVAMPVMYDPATLQAEVFMSFTISVLLMLGARIAALHVREEKERMDGQLALQSAQQGLYLGELRMQRAAETLEQVSTSIHQAHERLLDRMRLFLPEGEERRFSKQAIATRQEVFSSADGLYPRAWQASGLTHVLRQGSIAHALDALGITFLCDIKGRGLADFSPGFQLALYRLACEAVVYVHEQASLSCVHLRVRAGLSHGRCWVVLQMTGTHLRSNDTFMPSHRECAQFRERLGAMAEGVSGIRHSVRIYRGTVHARSTEHATRLSLGLQDGENLSGRPQ